jgi:glucose/arabinose dehydrogenase
MLSIPLHRSPLIAAACCVAAILSASAAAPAVADGATITPVETLATGLVDRSAGTVAAPTDIAFTPDGVGLVTTDAGVLRLIRDGRVVEGQSLSLTSRMCSGGERGMLGVAVDPNYASNRRIFVFWTYDKHDFCGVGTDLTPVNRVSSFRLDQDERVVKGSAKVLVDNIPSPATNHNAGDLDFGADGLLYITTGDGGCQIGAPDLCGAANDNSRRLDVPNGKVLRVTPRGEIPASNPYVDFTDARRCTAPSGPEAGSGPCVETFASGFRNPFRMDVRPGTSTPWVNDVGQDVWEEINRVTSGADYGWNLREGFCVTGSALDCTPSSFADPFYAYDHTTDCRSITGAAFVPTGTWGGRFADQLVFADFTCDSIWRVQVGAGSDPVPQPLAVATAPSTLTFGPSPRGRALYYAEYFSGEIRRITPS